ncbi:MAG: YfhO family protein, partial [Oscillospiraceae bacterium]
PLYFLNSNIEKRKKIGTAVLLVAVFASMYLSTIDLAWHGFQVPNWLNYRYSFTFCFVMLIAAAEAFERIEGVTLKQIGITLAILLVYVVYVDSLKLKHLPTTGAIWFSILCIVGFGILLFYYKNHATVKTAPLVLLILVVGELFGSTFDTLKAIDKDVTYSKHSSYVNYIEDGRELISDLEKIDGGLYRTEKTFHRTVNDPMAWGFKGISHSSSTLNAEAIQLIKRLGFTCGGHSIKYKGGTFASDAILGIKYVINKDEDIYYEKEVLKKDDMTVYENPYALPLAFLVDNGIKDVQMSSSNPFINQNSILNGMTAEPYTDYFTEMEIANKNLENVTEGNSGDHRKYAPVDKDTVAQVEYLVDVPTDDISYMYLDTTYRRDVNYWVNNRFLDADKDNSNIHALGRFDAGDTISFITTLDADDLLVKNMWFYQLDEEKLAETVEELKKSPLEIEEFTDTHIKGTVTAAENQTLFTTITDEPGWTIKIDGKKVEPVKLLNATIGVDVPVGTHVITMDFFPKGLKIGLILSGIGIILVIFIGIFEYKRRKVLLKRLYN